MIARRSRRAPVEPLSARVLRYRIARGYSPSDLASAAGVWGARFDASNPADQSTNVCWRRSRLRSECRCAGSCAENTAALSERAFRPLAWTLRLNRLGGALRQHLRLPHLCADGRVGERLAVQVFGAMAFSSVARFFSAEPAARRHYRRRASRARLA